MATVNGVNYTKVNSEPSSKVPEGELAGKVKFWYDEYTFLAEYANNDVIQLGGVIPEGARIVSAKVYCPDVGGTATVEFGTSSDTDYFIAAIDNSGQAVLAAEAAASAFLAAGNQSADVQPQIKCNGASASATGKTIKAWITYVMD
jgi:hypothetical protein